MKKLKHVGGEAIELIAASIEISVDITKFCLLVLLLSGVYVGIAAIFKSFS